MQDILLLVVKAFVGSVASFGSRHLIATAKKIWSIFLLLLATPTLLGFYESPYQKSLSSLETQITQAISILDSMPKSHLNAKASRKLATIRTSITKAIATSVLESKNIKEKRDSCIYSLCAILLLLYALCLAIAKVKQSHSKDAAPPHRQ
jgi:hypothetical protein